MKVLAKLAVALVRLAFCEREQELYRLCLRAEADRVGSDQNRMGKIYHRYTADGPSRACYGRPIPGAGVNGYQFVGPAYRNGRVVAYLTVLPSNTTINEAGRCTQAAAIRLEGRSTLVRLGFSDPGWRGDASQRRTRTGARFGHGPRFEWPQSPWNATTIFLTETRATSRTTSTGARYSRSEARTEATISGSRFAGSGVRSQRPAITASVGRFVQPRGRTGGDMTLPVQSRRGTTSP